MSGLNEQAIVDAARENCPDEATWEKHGDRLIDEAREMIRCYLKDPRVRQRPVSDEEVEAAARAIAEADGWPWHEDDYVSPDPKWQPTDKAEYREVARAALTAAKGASRE